MAGWSDYGVGDGDFSNKPIIITYKAIVEALKEKVYIFNDQAGFLELDSDTRPTVSQLEDIHFWCWYWLTAATSNAGFCYINNQRPYFYTRTTLESIVGPMQDWHYCTAAWANQIYQILNLYTTYRTEPFTWTASTPIGNDPTLSDITWSDTIDAFVNHGTNIGGSTYRYDFYFAGHDHDNYEESRYYIYCPQNSSYSYSKSFILTDYSYLTSTTNSFYFISGAAPYIQYQPIGSLREDTFKKFKSYPGTAINTSGSFEYFNKTDVNGCSFITPPYNPDTASSQCTVYGDSNYMYLEDINFKFHS